MSPHSLKRHAEWLPVSKRTYKKKPSKKRINQQSSSLTKISTAEEEKGKFPFHKLLPELRNKIYGLVLDDFFDDCKKNKHPLSKELSFNAIPYTSTDRWYGIEHKAYLKKNPILPEIRGMKAKVLPAFEKLLKASNEQLYHEFSSIRIARSELWLNARLSANGIDERFSHKGLRMAMMDKQHIEQVSYSIMGHGEGWRFADSIAIQNRFNALGSTFEELATDTTLPHLSRVSVHMTDESLRNTLGWRKGLFARYRWDTFLRGLRLLVKSGRLSRFELRLPQTGRSSRIIRELAKKISTMVGRAAETTGRGCTECWPRPIPEEYSVMQQNIEFSLIWKARKGRLDVKDCQDRVEMVDFNVCAKCGMVFEDVDVAKEDPY